ncbi:uncharacterized protein LOC109861882, partial [Pseudomyrmex gracilis]|uniref:uncharacterized protein LOC109861882 n=1 Tax=Pseudomyrmex gracilis TaxID=219809 RepID=UPI000994D459
DEENKENDPGLATPSHKGDILTNEQVKDSALKVLGVDPNFCTFKKLTYHPELKNTWSKWKNGLPAQNKKDIVESYDRKGDFYMEAPKLNLEILPLLSDIAKKRDQHFVQTQNCVGTPIAALGAAVSLLLEPPQDGLDEDLFTDLISHAGQILTDVFHQQSVARKSFITLQLNKSVKPVVETIISNEWLDSGQGPPKKQHKVSVLGKLEIPTCGIPSGRLSAKTSPNQVQTEVEQVIARCDQDISDDEPVIVQEISKVDKSAGRLRSFVSQWKQITSDKYILSCLSGYRIPFTETPFQRSCNVRNLSAEETENMHTEIDELLRKGAIEECKECERQSVSSYFLVPKPDGSHLFILNLRSLNRFINPPHFKLEDIRSALNLVSRGDFLGTLDLRDAYFLVPIHADYRKFLRFKFKGKMFQFVCLPFGLCTSPYVFTKLMKPIVNTLRQQDKKKSHIVQLVSKLKRGKAYDIRKFAKLLGTLASACPAVSYGLIHCKRLEQQKYLALKFNGGDYDGKIWILESMLEELTWWRQNVVIGTNPIRTQLYAIEIFSDASLSGWGCYCNSSKAFRVWDEHERSHHINYLELLAAFFAIKCFAAGLSHAEVLLRLDNKTAIAYINKARGVQFPHLSKLSRKIWNWCEAKKLWLQASYIPSAENIEADRASRNVHIDAEWELSQSAFQQIAHQLGPFSVDLFASRLNAKCETFHARFPDPEAAAIDAFTISWTGLSEEAMEVMVNSNTTSTLKQYECGSRNWWDFTHRHQLDMFNAQTTAIISFLHERYKEGASYRCFQQRPARLRYVTTWDVAPVLDYIEKLHPLKQLKLKEAVKKIVTLLALTTAQRLQTLSLIHTVNIVKSDVGISIKILERIKTTKPGAFQPDLILPFFKEKLGLCVASAILDYIDYTKELRNKDTKNLFIATTKPFGAVSSQTIAHWIKTLLAKAGVDTNQFSAYSTRHAAVSNAHNRGVDIPTIRRTAGWAPNSQMFFKFYNKPIQTTNDQFAHAFLR